MAFDANAFSMYNTAAQQTQARIAAYRAALAGNPAGAGMLNAAIKQETDRLTSYQAGSSAQKAQYPLQVNEAGYELQRGGVREKFGAQLAAQDYSRTLAQQRHARQSGDFGMQTFRARQSLDSPYLQRGMFRSGARQQGLVRFRQDQASQAGQLAQSQAQEMANIAQQRAAAQQEQQARLNAINVRRQQDIFNQLAGLRALGG